MAFCWQLVRLRNIVIFGGQGLIFRQVDSINKTNSHMGAAPAQQLLRDEPSGEGTSLSFPHGGSTGEQE